ncbi:GH22272 [Drosophila grimshawi]|uniref:GH22272 n=1 Tax=Drosophila grimshawi TaxID=7222 RepID=B4JZ40_DROGR|nr:GH22272 [Drosophila grimshawi]
MPYAIKCLLDIQKHGRAVLLIFQGLEDMLYYSMNFLGCTMVMPEAKLMIRNGPLEATADNLPRNIFSNILEKLDSKLTGQYDKTRLSGLPGFGIIAITAHFHGVGKWWMRTMVLKSSTKNITPFSGRALATLPSMPS